jgi:CRP-like cAMP-binding protein
VRTIEDLLGEAPALAPLEPAHRAVIAGCGRNIVFEAGEYLMREGDPADTFYLIREGSATIEMFVPTRGAVTLQTLDDGDLAAWSWLVPPYRVAFDVRATSRLHAIAFDGACLRGKAEQDPALGYDLLKLFAAVIVERLQRTRIQLLDVYGPRSRS